MLSNPVSRLVPVLATSLLIAGCSDSPTGVVVGEPVIDAGSGTGTTLAIVGAAVVTMESEAVLNDHTIIVVDGRIEAIGPDGVVQVPADARRVEAGGRFVIPGLADMHVHMNRSEAPLYPDWGVTTVRNLWGFVELAAIIDDIESGALAGPTIYSLSPGLDGTPPKWPQTQLVLDPAEAPAVVDAQVAAGYGTLKLYQDLRPDVFEAIVDHARSRGLDYGGHVPHRVGLDRVLEVGYRSIEHLSGYGTHLSGGSGGLGFQVWAGIDTSLMPEVADRTVQAGVWNCPTLAIALDIVGVDVGSGAAFAVNRRRMVRALHDAGAGLLVGTDSGIGRTSPGTSLHDELAEFVEAGLSPYEALRGATIDAASFLGESDTFGRVVPGLRADLVLLEGNPLEDITATRRIAGVVQLGVWRQTARAGG